MRQICKYFKLFYCYGINDSWSLMSLHLSLKLLCVYENMFGCMRMHKVTCIWNDAWLNQLESTHIFSMHTLNIILLRWYVLVLLWVTGWKCLPYMVLKLTSWELFQFCSLLQQSWNGGILVSLCPSVHPSVHLWTELCQLCIFNRTCQIHFIFTHLIKQLQKGCGM